MYTLDNISNIIGRNQSIFKSDLLKFEKDLNKEINNSRFLILGGAGSIGHSVAKEIFRRNPLKLHIVDISENNLVELVRDLRSDLGYIQGDFKTFSIDIGSSIYNSFWESDGKYDYILNFSALKHVRSERDPFTLMRMIEVNILNTIKTIQQARSSGVKKYFCVSTDKAANPANMMGASKRIMELFLMRESGQISISTARFANVAFSDGSLLYGFNQRVQKRQPIVAPNDIKRYFITPKESAELCLMSCLLGENRDIFFPKLSKQYHLFDLVEIAIKYLNQLGFEPFICKSEEEARKFFTSNPWMNSNETKYWPCYFSPSDTSGEKDCEEFYTAVEKLELEKYKSIGIVKSDIPFNDSDLKWFSSEINRILQNGKWSKDDLTKIFNDLLPSFDHKEKSWYLDNKM